ncbi:hypothetical protein COT42_06810 [Candidatus Saganbacteria bacterium CG08_land_8_20_14_0_20_45_16]|uniref:Uncharacterized protein n=1 Tax=Candidatus Saganbacteria bacterium CG08_land_8_20_14_0_20_45_16 TaxID=2014293 RepID=A0A2H0XVJ9_UNCSA|nr:MAG: hypothetical protein COT42_06810 [Candidatus Saganbacteria bacterium CG08_land_8_20_14_0_20_45_16]
MAKDKLDQILEAIGSLKEGQDSLKSDVDTLTKGQDTLTKGQNVLKADIVLLKEGQQRNYDLIQKNGIKIEQVASDVKAVAEGHGVLRSEMGRMEDRLTNKIGLVQTTALAINDKLDEHIKQPAHA